MHGRRAKNLVAGAGMLVLLAAPPALAQGKRMDPGSSARPNVPKQVPASAREDGPQHGQMHHEGRMTPEQRRQLRRDVHNHGRDIYRERTGPKQH